MTLYEQSFKRVFDALAAACAIVALSPLLLLTALAILLEDGGPVIFRQARMGRNGRTFVLMKFRSMPVGTPDLPSAASKTLTVTRVGAIIRRTNVDELPQLINILRGDMSVVGPRPALPSQETLLAARNRAGVSVLRPGLTGLAQVRSYDGMPEAEKVDWERRYAARVTFLGDVGIILATVGYLFRRPPVY